MFILQRTVPIVNNFYTFEMLFYIKLIKLILH